MANNRIARKSLHPFKGTSTVLVIPTEDLELVYPSGVRIYARSDGGGFFGGYIDNKSKTLATVRRLRGLAEFLEKMYEDD